MFYNLDEIIAVCDGYFFYKAGDCVKDKEYKFHFSWDQTDKDTIFLPLKMMINGQDWDNYKENIEKAIKKGAPGFLFAENMFSEDKYENLLLDLLKKYRKQIKFVIFVKGTTTNALEKLAMHTRNHKLDPDTKIIAITGTMGKTSTTEMIYSVLQQSHEVYRGRPTLNVRYIINHKLLEVDRKLDYLLFECSGAVKGYLKYFSELLRPDAIILTKIAIENISVYDSLIQIARNKSSIMNSMSENSIAVIDDDKFLYEPASWYKPKKIFVSDKGYELLRFDKSGSKFRYKGVEYTLPVVGYHQITNALKVIELCLALGISTDDIVAGLAKFQQAMFRWQVDSFKDDVNFITDCPNPPNYDNIIENIRMLYDLYPDSPCKRIVLSKIEFLEHYEREIYEKLAKHLIERNFDEVIVVGDGMDIMVDYIKNNSNLKLTFMKKLEKLDKDEPLIRYLIDTLDKPQAILLKTRMHENGVGYGLIRNIIRQELKDRII